VHLVLALEVQLLPLLDPGQGPYYGDGLAGPLHLKTHYRIVAFRVSETEALYRTLQGFQRLLGKFGRYGRIEINHNK
jgi:hypothetical protein